VQQAGTVDVNAVRQALYGQVVEAPSGVKAVMNTNHHLSKPVMIGEIQPNAQFDIVWQTKGPIKADAWSKYIPESAKLTADWTYPWVCGNCEKPKFGGQ
jgi:urea transport system substrate-binding protein